MRQLQENSKTHVQSDKDSFDRQRHGNAMATQLRLENLRVCLPTPFQHYQPSLPGSINRRTLLLLLARCFVLGKRFEQLSYKFLLQRKAEVL